MLFKVIISLSLVMLAIGYLISPVSPDGSNGRLLMGTIRSSAANMLVSNGRHSFKLNMLKSPGFTKKESNSTKQFVDNACQLEVNYVPMNILRLIKYMLPIRLKFRVKWLLQMIPVFITSILSLPSKVQATSNEYFLSSIFNMLSLLRYKMVNIMKKGNMFHQTSIQRDITMTLIGSALTLLVMKLSNMTKLFKTSDDVPNDYIRQNKVISGKIVQVTDGDTFRIRHKPHIFSSDKFDGKLSDNTIVIRIAAVDCPETKKFGKEGQPFGDIAKKYTEEVLLNKKVYVKFLSRDQYGRLVSSVTYKDKFHYRDLSEDLLRKGYAMVYRQMGGQYDGSIEKWDKIEAIAKENKLGLWSLNGFESPAEYKAKNRD